MYKEDITMVRCIDYTVNDSDMTAKVQLEADSKSELANISTDDIVGYPTGYTMDFMSSCFTSDAELGFLKSDGTWNWGA